jgi:hypothetical protein
MLKGISKQIADGRRGIGKRLEITEESVIKNTYVS